MGRYRMVGLLRRDEEEKGCQGQPWRIPRLTGIGREEMPLTKKRAVVSRWMRATNVVNAVEKPNARRVPSRLPV